MKASKEDIKLWYELGLWTKQMVYDAVPEMITAEDYEEITGDPYVPGEGLANNQDFQNALNELGVSI